MSSYLVQATNGRLSGGPLLLPFAHVNVSPDPEEFHAQARGDEPPPPLPPLQGGSLRAVRLSASARTAWPREIESSVLFLVSGELRLHSNGVDLLAAKPGDLIQVDKEALQLEALTWSGDARGIVLTIPGLDRQGRAAPDDSRGKDILLTRMYSAEDGESYFRDFPELFDFPGAFGPEKGVLGTMFITLDLVFDYHPEVVNNLVLVVSGVFELEVAGGQDRVKLFEPGSVCLAEDKTGRGHIDRTHGDCAIIVLRMADDQLW